MARHLKAFLRLGAVEQGLIQVSRHVASPSPLVFVQSLRFGDDQIEFPVAYTLRGRADGVTAIDVTISGDDADLLADFQQSMNDGAMDSWAVELAKFVVQRELSSGPQSHDEIG